jgi:hypothetical protein
MCTQEQCKLDADGVRGVCKVVSEVSCVDVAVPDCHTAAKCDPTTGKCELGVKDDNVTCTKDEWLSHHNNTLPSSLNPALPCATFSCQMGQCSMVQNTPCCGNGILEDGEQCDYYMHRFADCCSQDCKGCLCGNGKLDAGEQCDWGIKEQAACCDMQCGGCTCGNGILDAGEECDPAIPSMAKCCNSTCVGCAPPPTSRRKAVAFAAGGAVALLGAFALAAAIVVMTKAAGAPAAGLASGAATNPAVGDMHINPLHAGSAGGTSALYVPAN